MARNLTKLSDLIDPEVMADMISAKLPDKIRVTPFAKVDNTLEGAEGDTITVPSFNSLLFFWNDCESSLISRVNVNKASKISSPSSFIRSSQ